MISCIIIEDNGEIGTYCIQADGPKIQCLNEAMATFEYIVEHHFSNADNLSDVQETMSLAVEGLQKATNHLQRIYCKAMKDQINKEHGLDNKGDTK